MRGVARELRYLAMSSEVALLPVLSNSALHQMLNGSQNRKGRLSGMFEFLLFTLAPSLIGVA